MIQKIKISFFAILLILFITNIDCFGESPSISILPNKAVKKICNESLPIEKREAIAQYFLEEKFKLSENNISLILGYFETQPKYCSKKLMDIVFRILIRKAYTIAISHKLMAIVQAKTVNPDFQALLYSYLYRYNISKCSNFQKDKNSSIFKQKTSEFIDVCKKKSLIPYLLEYSPNAFISANMSLSEKAFKTFSRNIIEIVKNTSQPKTTLAYLELACYEGDYTSYLSALNVDSLRSFINTSISQQLDKHSLKVLNCILIRDFKNQKEITEWWKQHGKTYSPIEDLTKRLVNIELSEKQLSEASNYILTLDFDNTLDAQLSAKILQQTETFIFKEKVPYEKKIQWKAMELADLLYLNAGGDDDRPLPLELDTTITDKDINRLRKLFKAEMKKVYTKCFE